VSSVQKLQEGFQFTRFYVGYVNLTRSALLKAILEPEDDLEVVGEFGRGGRQVGQFLRPHGMSVDSQGNIYVGEASTGRRVQKFTVSGG